MAFSLEKNTKKAGFVLTKLQIPVLRVWQITDVSGSARDYHGSGLAQLALNIIAVIAFLIDDDGKLPTAIFSSKWKIIKEMTKQNWENFVKKEIMVKELENILWNYTYFNGVLRGVLKEEGFINKKEQKVDSPNDDKTWVAVYTDGDFDDPNDVLRTLKEFENSNVFIMFIGLGEPRSDFRTLKQWAWGNDEKNWPLDSKNHNLYGFKNVDFVNFKQMQEELEGDDVYDRILTTKFGKWYNGNQEVSVSSPERTSVLLPEKKVKKKKPGLFSWLRWS